MEDKKTPVKSSIYHTYLVGPVDEKTTKEVMRDIDNANNLDHIKQIVLTISSRGGFLYCGFALYDQIKASKKPIDIIAAGYCMSAAVMIMQAGRKRLARPHTSFMVHPSNYNQPESRYYSEVLTIVDEYKKNHDLFIKLSIDRAGIERKDFEALYEPRKYLSAEEALKLGKNGLIDEILE